MVTHATLPARAHGSMAYEIMDHSGHHTILKNGALSTVRA
jgi:hypothetical protein